jgi:hypothetical protein
MRGAWPACLGAVGWGRAPITHWGLMASLRRRTVARSSAHAALKGPLPRLGVLGGFVVVLVASALPLAWASPSGPVSLGAATKASIHQVRISGSSIAFAPTRQRGVPTARFSVTLPSDATRLTYVHFELRGYTNAAQSSFRTLLVNITCSSKTACKKSGSTVDVTLPLRFAIDSWTAGLLHPGTYHPYVLVYTDSPSAGPASVELSTPTVAVRRRTRIKPFDAARAGPPRPQGHDHRSAAAREVMPGPGDELRCRGLRILEQLPGKAGPGVLQPSRTRRAGIPKVVDNEREWSVPRSVHRASQRTLVRAVCGQRQARGEKVT